MIRRLLRITAAALLLAIGAGILVFAIRRDSAGQKDFIEYWAAGKQLLHRANPYDPAAILALERTAGYDASEPLVSFSPPPSLVWTVPLGLIGSKAGLIVWLLALVGSLVASIRILWLLAGQPNSRTHLLGYLFAPVFACLIAGQLGIFLLLAVTAFLWLHESRPFLAGAALLPCALKPHLFLPLAVVLVVWAMARRSFALLAGVGLTNLLAAAAVFWLDPGVWVQYRAAMSQMSPTGLFVPTWSMVLRLLVHRQSDWLQFVPDICACAWALWFYWKRRARWKWGVHGLLVSLVSLLCAPYAWFSDEAILLPAVLAACYRVEDADGSLAPFGVIAGAALIEVFAHVPLTSPYYLWTTPAWLGWYLYASRFTRLADATVTSPR